MEAKEIDIKRFISEAERDSLTKSVEHDPSKSLIAIDYGTLEYTVLIHYLSTPEGLTILDSMTIGSQDITIDTVYPYGVGSAGIDLLGKDGRAYDYKTPPREPYPSARLEDNSHDQFGNYRYDFGRNGHSRSPRKRK